MHAPVLRPLGQLPFPIYVRRCRYGFLAALLAMIVTGCAPFEVHVLQANEPASEATTPEERSQQEGEEPAAVDPLTEGVLVTVVAYLTVFAEICGALVIAVGLVQALVQYGGLVLH